MKGLDIIVPYIDSQKIKTKQTQTKKILGFSGGYVIYPCIICKWLTYLSRTKFYT